MKQKIFFQNQCDVEKTISATCKIINICRKHNIQTWLSWGALLGIIREKRLLPWNNDVELMVIADENYEKKIQKLAREISKDYFHCTYYKDISALSIRSISNDVNININFSMIYKDNIIRPHETADGNIKGTPLIAKIFWLISVMINSRGYYSLKNLIRFSLKYKIKYLSLNLINLLPELGKIFISRNLHNLSKRYGGESYATVLPKNLILPLKEIKFYETKIFIPNKPEEFLSYIYGEEWRIPKENWSFYDKENKKNSSMKYYDINLFGADLSNNKFLDYFHDHQSMRKL